MGTLIFVLIIISTVSNARADELDSWFWRQPLPHNQQVFSITRGAGLWLVAGHNGTVATSVDGVEWDLSTAAPNVILTSATWGNGRFVLSGGGFSGLFLSTDGHNWTTVATNLSHIAFGNGRFVAVDGSGAIWFSENAETWTKRQLSFSHQLGRVSFANRLFFASGSRTTQQYGYFISSDGENWSNSLDLGTNRLEKVVYANGRYVGLGTISSGGIPTGSQFLTSTNGTAWNAPVTFNGYDIDDITVANDRFVAVEISGRTLVSIDGVTWSEQNAPELLLANKLLWADGTFVSASHIAAIVTSTDGSNWVRRTIGSNNSLTGVIQNNGLLVAVGGNLGDEGSNLSSSTVVTSLDGRNWTQRDPGTTQSLAAVTFGNGRYVAVGAAGTVVHTR